MATILTQTLTESAGLTEKHTDTDTAVAMLMLRMEQLEIHNRQLQARLAQSQGLPVSTEDMEKTNQALRLNQDQREKILTERPQYSPEEIRQIELAAAKDAEKRQASKREAFLAYIKSPDVPKGEVFNHGEPVLFQINGISAIIKKGLNRNVPHPFLALWKDRQESQEVQQRRQSIVEVDSDTGHIPTVSQVDQWIHDRSRRCEWV
jgi:hypothetical protein